VLGAIGVRLRLITTARGACVCDSGIHNPKKPSTMCYETVDGGERAGVILDTVEYLLDVLTNGSQGFC
jgi:hypothetical protein